MTEDLGSRVDAIVERVIYGRTPGRASELAERLVATHEHTNRLFEALAVKPTFAEPSPQPAQWSTSRDVAVYMWSFRHGPDSLPPPPTPAPDDFPQRVVFDHIETQLGVTPGTMERRKVEPEADALEGLRSRISARLIARAGPVPKPFNDVTPVHFRHPFAVYELAEGRFTVTRNGSMWGRPFETSDRELAVIVCDRWAREFEEEQ
ncbi:hypothetical protein IMZ11_02490 [Microtetraspora sp. AC03309]|uniref:hypothetical protein n=1 Tax=Microtetraspora sp. AC03309 TaxID=2779376 RepID=UPI001E531C82|nr:hypothetical protein [Microtetraspora sp. AC03309]MCC5574507.1 hypothetical protein [Microtetraspora sp. AC03309]